MAIFDPENAFWRPLGKLSDVLTLSIGWTLLSLPVVTMGAATAALYDSVSHCLLGGENGPMARFWNTFKRELKGSIPAMLLWGGLCFLLGWGVWTVRFRVAFEGAAAVALLGLWYAVLLLPVGCLCWMFPLLSRFSFHTGGLISTALRLTLGCFPRTILIVVTALISVSLTLWMVLPVVVLPCLTAVVWVKVMDPVFRRYTPGE